MANFVTSGAFARGRGAGQSGFDSSFAPLLTFEFVADAAAANIPSQVTTIRTEHHTSHEGGGGAFYHVTPTLEIGGFQNTVDNRYWGLAESAPDVTQFGAVGDGVTNDQPAFQTAYYWSLTYGIIVGVPATVNSYLITSPILCFSSNPRRQCGFRGYGAWNSSILTATFEGPDTFVFAGSRPQSGVRTGVTVAGAGYTPGTYTNVPLTGSAGPRGAVATITVNGAGQVSDVTPTIYGDTYEVGDVLSATDETLGGGGGAGFTWTVDTVRGGVARTTANPGVIAGGSGYVDGTYYRVPLTGGGIGTGALANIVVSGGAVTDLDVLGPGVNYAVGVVLGASASNLGGSGTGFSWTTAAIANRGITPVIDNIRIEYGANTIDPIAYDFEHTGPVSFQNLSSSASNNTQFNLTNMTNCTDSTGWQQASGGKVWGWRATTSITFSITQGSTNLQASAAYFIADDANNRVIYIESSTGRGELFRVTAFVNDQNVTVEGLQTPGVGAQLTVSGGTGTWEPNRATIAVNTNTLTTEASGQGFTSNNVGYTLYIQGAGPSGSLLRAKIIAYVDPNTVLLDTIASTGVTNTEFCVPSAVFGGEGTSLTETVVAQFSSFVFNKPVGAIVLQNLVEVKFDFFDVEVAVPTASVPTDPQIAHSCFWIDGGDVELGGNFKGNPVSGLGKVRYTGLNSSMISLRPTASRLVNNEALVSERNNDADTRILVDSFSLDSNTASTSPNTGVTLNNIFDNESDATPKIFTPYSVRSFNQVIGDIPADTIGGKFYGRHQNAISTNLVTGVVLDPVFQSSGGAGAAVIAYGVQETHWWRDGNNLFFRCHLTVSGITVGAAAAGNLQIDPKLPFTPYSAIASGGWPATLGQWRWLATLTTEACYLEMNTSGIITCYSQIPNGGAIAPVPAAVALDVGQIPNVVCTGWFPISP